MAGTRFVRIHGRIVPIRDRSGGAAKKGSAAQKITKAAGYIKPADAVGAAKAGAATATASFGAMKGFQYLLFKRGERIRNVAEGYAKRQPPTMHVETVLKRGKTALLPPSIFDQSKYSKASAFYQAGQRKAAKFGSMARPFLGAARFVSRNAGKFAIGLGVLSAAAYYAGRVMASHNAEKKK